MKRAMISAEPPSKSHDHFSRPDIRFRSASMSAAMNSARNLRMLELQVAIAHLSSVPRQTQHGNCHHRVRAVHRLF